MIVQGYASLFNVKDEGRDIVMPGAFTNSLRKRPAAQIRFFWEHDRKHPIGVIRSVRLDNKGLYFEGEISPETMYGPSAVAMVEKKGVNVSIGYKTLLASHQEEGGEMYRQLKEVDLREISLVSLPMCDGTEVWRAPTTSMVAEKSADLNEIVQRVHALAVKTATARAQAVLDARTAR